jgi:hypothetical protein
MLKPINKKKRISLSVLLTNRTRQKEYRSKVIKDKKIAVLTSSKSTLPFSPYTIEMKNISKKNTKVWVLKYLK